MSTLDWLVVSGYFLVMIGIGMWASSDQAGAAETTPAEAATSA